MRPGPRLVTLLAWIAVAALAAPLLPPLAPAVALALALAIGAALGEFLYLRGVTVTAERPPALVLSLDEEERISLALRTDAARPVALTIRQLLPALLDRRSVTLAGVCGPGAVLTLELPARGTARGAEKLEAPWVASTVWGLAERVAQVGATTELRVVPNLAAVRRMHEQLNTYALRGVGTRVSPRLGKGREFDRLRDYVIDDDVRDMAWKATARHGKPIVREFRIDRSQDVLVCLDRGHRMAARTTQITKVDHAVNAAVLLAYICNRMEDRIGLLSFGAEVERGVPQGRGPAHLRRLMTFATAVKPEYIHTDYLALGVHVRRRVRHRTLVLIVTDLPEGDNRHALVRAVRTLLPQHLPLVLVVSDPALWAAAHVRPADRPELCRTLVARDVWTERRQTMRDLTRLGALVVETQPENLGLHAVNAYIDVKRRQIL
ncbi:MAG: DUF58 domain-containing protein [Planctomycetes bacterium]|nr:DUF58 domain-containing protein [Planctomycetota bacterium]